MKLIQALLRLVPLDPRGRRAVEEVLADWRYESASAATPWQRVVVTASSLGALALTLVLVTARDVRAIGSDSVLAVTGVWIGLFTIAAWVQMSVAPPIWPADIPHGTWPRIEAGWIAMRVVSLLPLAFFLAASFPWRKRSRQIPGLGLAALAFGSILIADGWLLPLLDPQSPVFSRRDGNSEYVFSHFTSLLGTRSSILSPLATLRQINSGLASGVTGAALVMLAVPLRGRKMALRVLAVASWLACAWVTGRFWWLSLNPFQRDFYFELLTAWVIPCSTMAIVGGLALRRATMHGRMAQ